MRSVWTFLRSALVPAIIFALFLVVFLWGLNESFPMLGHDFYYFFPRLLAGKWHFLAQGLAPFRYAAQLCGGFPVYGNPHDVYYSLPQLLSLFLSLWTAVQLSIVCAMVVGYIGWYRFGRDVSRLPAVWAHVLALIILANGYYFMHMIAGHLSYHTLPLMGWLLWFLFQRRKESATALVINSAVVGLIGAYILFAAGYFVLLLTGVTFLMLLPFDLASSGTEIRNRLLQIGKRIAGYGIAFFLLNISKFVAIYSLMRFLPRTTSFDAFPEGASGIWFIMKSFFMLPQGSYLFPDGVDKWGIHEYSMFVSPVVIVGCCVGLWQWVQKRRQTEYKQNWWLVVYGALLILAFTQLTVGHGFLIDWLKHLPIFSSLRVTVRFLYIPSILLSIGSVIALSRAFSPLRKTAFVLPVAGAITILSFVAAYTSLLHEETLQLTVPYDRIQNEILSSNYLNQNIGRVQLLPAIMPSDIESVLSASTSPGCYEPLLTDATFRKHLTEGVTSTITNGAFNLNNPACLQYPEENNCTPGDLIAETDKDNFQLFINGLPATWKMSTLQHGADRISVLSLIAAMMLCVWAIIRRKMLPVSGGNVKNSWKQIQTGALSLLQHGRTQLLQEKRTSSDSFRLFLTIALSIIGIAFVAYICAFKLLDRDFWWHITAGKVMVQTGALIQTEPFAYTRVGLPYVANHEWLAQIFLYLIYSMGGSTGIILFRTFTMFVVLTLPLLLWRRGIWLLMPLAILAANSMRPAFIERPQLFTFMIFSLCLTLTLWILERGGMGMLLKQHRLRLISVFAVVHILWVNLHGGAAFIGLLFPGVLFLEAVWEWIGKTKERAVVLESLRWSIILGVAIGITFFLSPIGHHNITYLWDLLTDRTIIYIQEWQPRELGSYLKLIGPFWIIGAAAIAIGRRHMVASVLLVVMTGVLGKGALRHETLFVLSVFAVTIYQLKNATQVQSWTREMLRRPMLTVLSLLLLLFGLAAHTHAQFASFVKEDQLAGYGTFEFGKDAVDFLEREGIKGKMFNSYGIGGYLINRGYPDPDRRVFIDGRNVDYGFAMMNQTYLAGIDPVQWQKLADKHGFTYAVVDYFSNKDKKKNVLNYSQILDEHPEWPIVYFDDWVAVYLKKTPENAALINRLQYQLITATNMEFKTALERMPKTTSGSLLMEKELKHAVADSPQSIKARIMLARLYIGQKRLDEAQVVAQDAAIMRPGSPEPHAMFAAIFISQKEWVKAAHELDIALKMAGKDYPDIDYAFVAEVFAQAGRLSEARMYARRAGKVLTEAPLEQVPTLSGASLSSARSAVSPLSGAESSEAVPMVNPAQDAIDFHDKALELAQSGQNVEARENFLIALKLNPSFAEAWNNLGTLSFFENKLDEAKMQYERAVELLPEYVDAHFNLALLLLKTGDSAGAKTHMERAKELGKDIATLEQMLKR